MRQKACNKESTTRNHNFGHHSHRQEKIIMEINIIDPEIQELCHTINQTGWLTTTESCSGHKERNKNFYLQFSLSIKHIRQLCRILDKIDSAAWRTNHKVECSLVHNHDARNSTLHFTPEEEKVTFTLTLMHLSNGMYINGDGVYEDKIETINEITNIFKKAELSDE